MNKGNKELDILREIVLYCEKLDKITKRFGQNLDAFRQKDDYRKACFTYLSKIATMTSIFTEEFKKRYTAFPSCAVRTIKSIFTPDATSINIDEVWDTIRYEVVELKDFCSACLQGGSEIYMPPIDDIRRAVQPIAQKHGIDKVYLFGSHARGDATYKSDYDFRIEGGNIRSLLDKAEIMLALEEALGKQVDLVLTKNIVDEVFFNSIKEDEILVYG